MKNVILTGDRPTGKLHIGHYVGSLKRRVELQNSGAFDKIYIMIADAQALTDNFDNPDKVRANITEMQIQILYHYYNFVIKRISHIFLVRRRFCI